MKQSQSSNLLDNLILGVQQCQAQLLTIQEQAGRIESLEQENSRLRRELRDARNHTTFINTDSGQPGFSLQENIELRAEVGLLRKKFKLDTDKSQHRPHVSRPSSTSPAAPLKTITKSLSPQLKSSTQSQKRTQSSSATLSVPPPKRCCIISPDDAMLMSVSSVGRQQSPPLSKTLQEPVPLDVEDCVKDVTTGELLLQPAEKVGVLPNDAHRYSPQPPPDSLNSLSARDEQKVICTTSMDLNDSELPSTTLSRRRKTPIVNATAAPHCGSNHDSEVCKPCCQQRNQSLSTSSFLMSNTHPYRTADIELLRSFLGPGSESQIAALTTTAKQNLLQEARTKMAATMYRQSDDSPDRPPTPPGYWRVDMPSTQES